MAAKKTTDEIEPQGVTFTTRKYRLTFTEEILGTSPANPDLYRQYIASNRPDGPDEAEAAALPPVDDELKLAMTVFGREAGSPILWDYQIKGFFKDACGTLSRAPGTESSRHKAYKKIIDGLIFVEPRKIVLHLPDGAEIGVCERPLRASTAQGERIALARSETCPVGTWCEIFVTLLDAKLLRTLDEWMLYGKLKGLGQWRNSSKGRFTAVEAA